jgi:hypothetical protein
MTKRFVTIVSNQKGGFSFHSSWKSACETYDWEYTPRMKSQVDEYLIKKAPLDVTIDCLELVEFIGRKEIDQTCENVNGNYLFELVGYDTHYTVLCEYSEQHEPADYHYGDRGRETISEAYDYDQLESIIKVEILTEDGEKEIQIDKWTEEQLLNILEIKE